MKLQGRAIDTFLARPDPAVRAVVVYGPDVGLVKERAERLCRIVVNDLADPFRIAELSAKILSGDPVRLRDEAAALCFAGGRRLIRVRDADDGSAAAFTLVLQDPPSGDSLIVAEAGDLGARSRLRLLLEESPLGAALPCYVEDEASLRRVVADLLATSGLRVDPDAAAWLASNLVGDRLLARSEIEKLMLYMGTETQVDLSHVQAVVGDGTLIELDQPVWFAAEGDFAGVDRALTRLFADGTSPIGILRAAQGHFRRLHLVQAHVARGLAPDGAVNALKPPVFFKLRARLAAQVKRWPLPALAQALERLTEAEADCKRTGLPDEALCARTLLQLAAMARSAAR